MAAGLTLSSTPSHLVELPAIAVSNPQEIRRVPGLLTPPPEELSEYRLQHKLDSPCASPACPSSALVAVLGVGYVGLHLVQAFAQRYPVVAYDPDVKRLEDIATRLSNKNVTLSSDPQVISTATHLLVAVPTKLHHDKTIDTEHVRTAIDQIHRYARDGATVVIESSVAVGMTRSLLKELMITRRFMGGMSPERVDPGRTEPKFQDIPKVVSGLDDITPGSLASIHDLYAPIFNQIVPVSSPEVAEMTKLYENCQRMICLSYVNEMADACQSLGIDPLEVCRTAATKPFGYQPYTPGLGAGGHCIPVNGHYLSANARFPLLEEANRKMSMRPARVADRIMTSFLSQTTLQLTPRVLVVGAGFKRGQAGLSNSPGVSLMTHLLSNYEVYVEFVDPLVSQDSLSFVPKMKDQDWQTDLLGERFDIIVVALDQVGLDMSVLTRVKGTLIENFSPSLPWGRQV